jgi:cytochrome c
LSRGVGIFRAIVISVTFVTAIFQTVGWAGVAASPKKANSRQSPGEKLVRANDCISCHAVGRKVVGPAYRDVAKKYRGKSNAVQKLSQKIKRGGSGVWGQVPMTAHPALTTTQLREMLEWILSQGIQPAKQPPAQARAAQTEAVAKLYTYTLADGTTVKLDFRLFVEGQDQKVTKDIFHGYEMYNSYCYRCHGQDAMGSEIAPDLRHSLKAGMTEEQFLSTAMAGRQEKGMPSWAGFLSEEEVKRIYGYVKGRSLDLVPVGRPPSEMD